MKKTFLLLMVFSIFSSDIFAYGYYGYSDKYSKNPFVLEYALNPTAFSDNSASSFYSRQIQPPAPVNYQYQYQQTNTLPTTLYGTQNKNFRFDSLPQPPNANTRE